LFECGAASQTDRTALLVESWNPAGLLRVYRQLHCWIGWEAVMLGTILIIILILILLGALPTWPYSSGWGYYPSGGLGLVLVILIILVVMGRV
jgi:Protein of unknown function (DUF3309)